MAFFHDNKFEMCIDEATFNCLVRGQEVAWAKPYKCDGIDPTIFPNGELPMKKVLVVGGERIDAVAAMYYALAHRRKHVNGPPHSILRFEIGYQGLSRGFLSGTLVPHVEQHGVGFKKKLTRENYTDHADIEFHEIQNGQEVLEHGYNLLERKIIVAGFNA